MGWRIEWINSFIWSRKYRRREVWVMKNEWLGEWGRGEEKLLSFAWTCWTINSLAGASKGKQMVAIFCEKGCLQYHDVPKEDRRQVITLTKRGSPELPEERELQAMTTHSSDTTERLHIHFSLSCIGEGNGNLLQYSCLENPRDGGAWWAAFYGVAQSWTQLKHLSSSSKQRLKERARTVWITLVDQRYHVWLCRPIM